MRPSEGHEAAFLRLKKEVFDYSDWNKLLVELGLTTADKGDDDG